MTTTQQRTETKVQEWEVIRCPRCTTFLCEGLKGKAKFTCRTCKNRWLFTTD